MERTPLKKLAPKIDFFGADLDSWDLKYFKNMHNKCGQNFWSERIQEVTVCVVDPQRSVKMVQTKICTFFALFTTCQRKSKSLVTVFSGQMMIFSFFIVFFLKIILLYIYRA